MLPSLLAFLIADSRLSFLFSHLTGINAIFLELASFSLMIIIPAKEEGKAESKVTIQLFLQKEEALPRMHRGNIMRGDGGK